MASLRKILTVGSVKIYRSRELNEYVCKLPGQPESDYFTSDKADAIDTAHLIDSRAKAMTPDVVATVDLQGTRLIIIKDSRLATPFCLYEVTQAPSYWQESLGYFDTESQAVAKLIGLLVRNLERAGK